MSDPRWARKLSREDFIVRFFICAIGFLLFTLIVVFGIFVNASAFGALIPFVIVGFCFGLFRLGGWVYDRWYSSSTD